MRSATRRKSDTADAPGISGQRPAKPRLETVRPAKDAPARAAKPKLRLFHAAVQVTRVEEWFVEADTAEEARRLLEGGQGQRAQIGECLYFSVDKLFD